ncbi:MAG: hypothetical protein NTX52_13775 [Planctomycetota bacterium]|nr:hypothetical protein [Planctomycetota bacterium]
MLRKSNASAISGKTFMTVKARIKTDWASLSIARDGGVIVCVKSNNVPVCTYFKSSDQLKEAIRGRKIRVKKWAVALSKSSCILKQLTLPASDLIEAAKMIEFELSSLIPLPQDQIVYGCTPLSKQDNMLNVLVCIVKLSILNEHLKPFRIIGVEPHRIAIDSLAIQNWFDTANGNASDAEISALIDQRSCIVLTSINGNFHKANELIFSDSDFAACSCEILQEILRQREELPVSLKNKASVLLTGPEKYASEVKNMLHSTLGDATTTFEAVVVPHPRIVYFAADGKHEHSGDGLYYEAVVAAGLFELAVSSKLPHSNLLPQRYVRKHQKKALLFNYLLTSCLFVMLILLVWLFLVAVNWRISRICHTIESQIAPIEQLAGSVDSKRQRVKVMQRQLSNRGQITQIVEELYKYTPKTISISELRFVSEHSGASIEIKGQADLLANAFEYTDAVRKAELLSEMQIVNAQQIPRPGGSVVEFKAHCFIRNE